MPMFNITFLGTSGSAPTKQRGLSSVALEHNGNIMLFDCGEGTQRQMLTFGVNISKIKYIFITHMHADHVLGIAGLLRTMSLYHRTEPINIYFPDGYIEGMQSLLKFDNALIGFKIILHGIKAGTLVKENDFTVSAFKLNHSVKCYGYVFKESDKHRFMTKKCQSLGIKGKMFTEIRNKGHITISGERVYLKDVTTIEQGKKFVYATDTRPMASTAKAAINSDIFVHETTYTSDMSKQARERKHSTSEEAANLASKANAKKLILYHFSTRYKDTSLLLEEARSIFKNSYASYDGMKINVK